MKFVDPYPFSPQKNIKTEIPKPPLESGHPKRYRLSNITKCAELQAQFKDSGILHILGNLYKALMAIEQKEFHKARTQLDVPHELFGLRLEDFYARRRQTNTLYLDVLRLVCPAAIEETKFCIVLDDLRSFVNRLFVGYKEKKLAPVLKKITDAEKLLTINQKIEEDYRKNKAELEYLNNELARFARREKISVDFMTNLMFNGMNGCAEAVLILHPIEYRYKVNHHNRAFETVEEQLVKAEEDLDNTLKQLAWKTRKDDDVSDHLYMKQTVNIEILKGRLLAMNKEYERDSDYLNEQISYKRNSIEAMQVQLRNYKEKEIWMAAEVIKLNEWFARKKQKEHEEAVRIIMGTPDGKKRRRKKEKLQNKDIDKDVLKESGEKEK